MPEKLHRELVKRAIELGYIEGTPEFNRYVYGTLRKVEKSQKEKIGSDEEFIIPELPE